MHPSCHRFQGTSWCPHCTLPCTRSHAPPLPPPPPRHTRAPACTHKRTHACMHACTRLQHVQTATPSRTPRSITMLVTMVGWAAAHDGMGCGACMAMGGCWSGMRHAACGHRTGLAPAGLALAHWASNASRLTSHSWVVVVWVLCAQRGRQLQPQQAYSTAAWREQQACCLSKRRLRR